jgi:Caudovirus prohead serine protease
MAFDGVREAASAPKFIGPRTVVVRAVSYGPVDTHGTSWAPGCLTESVQRALDAGEAIPVNWAHDRHRVVGSVVGYRDTPDGLDLEIRLADPSTVPDAAMVASLLRDRHVDNVSIEFEGATGRPDPNHRGVRQVMRAVLAGLGFVARGSVPGARVLAMRSRSDLSAEIRDAQRILDRHESRARARLELDAAAAMRRLDQIIGGN